MTRDRETLFGASDTPMNQAHELPRRRLGCKASITPRLATLASSNEGDETWPSARVGASLVTADEGRGKVYLWGGRGGKEMGTFAGETGIWQFDAVGTKQWVELATTGDRPDPRSFHTMCTLNVSPPPPLLLFHRRAKFLIELASIVSRFCRTRFSFTPGVPRRVDSVNSTP